MLSNNYTIGKLILHTIMRNLFLMNTEIAFLAQSINVITAYNALFRQNNHRLNIHLAIHDDLNSLLINLT